MHAFATRHCWRRILVCELLQHPEEISDSPCLILDFFLGHKAPIVLVQLLHLSYQSIYARNPRHEPFVEHHLGLTCEERGRPKLLSHQKN